MPEQKQQFDDPEKQALWDHYVATQQEKDPAWKKFGRSVVDSISGAAEGLLGLKDPSDKTSIADWSNFATQGITNLAGLPFAAFKSRIPRLFHGTQKNFGRFDPAKYDKSDVLGWMTHAAENPFQLIGYGSKQPMIQYMKTPIGDVSISDFIKFNPQHTEESAIEYAKKAGYALHTK